MSRALDLQVTKCNSAKRKIDEISATESAEIAVLKRKRDRALHQIRCFTFNFKQGNFLDFNTGAPALKIAKLVSANTSKRKPDAISPSGLLQEQAGLQLIRQQQPVLLQAQQVKQHQQVQQQQVQQQQQQQVNALMGGTGPNYLALSTPPHARPLGLDTPAFAAAPAQNRALYTQHYAQALQGLQQEQTPRQRR
jgi:hypothetical protein